MDTHNDYITKIANDTSHANRYKGVHMLARNSNSTASHYANAIYAFKKTCQEILNMNVFCHQLISNYGCI